MSFKKMYIFVFILSFLMGFNTNAGGLVHLPLHACIYCKVKPISPLSATFSITNVKGDALNEGNPNRSPFKVPLTVSKVGMNCIPIPQFYMYEGHHDNNGSFDISYHIDNSSTSGSTTVNIVQFHSGGTPYPEGYALENSSPGITICTSADQCITTKIQNTNEDVYIQFDSTKAVLEANKTLQK